MSTFRPVRGGKYSFFAQPPTAQPAGQRGTQLAAKPRPTYPTRRGRAPHVCPAVPVVKMTVDDLIVEISVLFGRHRDIADDQVLGEREFKVANRAGLPCKVVSALLWVPSLGKCPS